MSSSIRTSSIRLGQQLRAIGHMGAATLRSPFALRDSTRMPSWPLSPEQRARVSVRWPSAYEWQPAETWVGPIRSGLEKLVPVQPAAIEQRYEGIVMIEVELDSQRYEVALDYFDRERLLDEVSQRCALIFKMQYDVDGYGLDHVVPGGYVPGHSSLYSYLPALRRIRDRDKPQFDVYGRFGERYAQEVRRAALAALRNQDRFQFEGGFAIRPYAAYLREAALSKIGIDLPGNGDMCHRLIEYMAVGCCAVRPTPRTRLPVPLEDGVNVRFAKRDASDLVEVCTTLLDDDEQRARLAAGARAYFDSYLRPDQLAGYYVDRCLSVLGPG